LARCQKELGLFNLLQGMQGMEGFSLRLLMNVMGWQYEEVQVLIAKVKKELLRKDLHSQFDL
jgi:hypothetical protein